jgi:hypothetical protein
MILTALFWLSAAVMAAAQQPQPPQPQPPQPAEPQRIEARREVIINWTMGDQAWNFNDLRTTYEPVKGYLESHGNEGFVAVWKLRLVRELEQGASKHHEEMLGSPFKVVLLDADRTVVDADAPAQITTPVGAKADDTIEFRVGLDAQALKGTRVIRVQRRTEVGF